MSRIKSTLFGIISSQLFMIITIMVSLFSTPYILRTLDAQIYGLSIIIYQITSYLGIFDFGLSAGITRNLAGTSPTDDKSKKNIETIITTSFVGYILLGCIVAIIGNLIAPFAPKIFDIPVRYVSQVRFIIGIICLLVGMQFILRCISGIFFAHQKQFISNTLSFILNISNTVFVIIFVYLGNGLWSYVYAQILVFLLNAVVSFVLFFKHYSYVKIRFKNYDYKLLKQMFSYGAYLFLNGIAVQIVFNTDRVMVGSIISLSAVSIFALSARLPELLTQLIWKIIDNTFPSMVEISKRGHEQFKNVHDKIMTLTLSLSSMGFWLIVLISYPFINLWVGHQFFAGAQLIIIIAFLYLIQHTFIHVTAVCLNGAGYVKGFSLLSVVEAAINIALTYYLGKKYGMSGIVLATIVSSLITTGWYVPYVGIKYMKSNFFSYILLLLKPIGIFSGIGVLAYYFLHEHFMRISSWSELIINAFVAAGLFAVVVLLLNREMCLTLKNKLLKKA